MPERAPNVPGTVDAPPCPVPLPLRGARNGAPPNEAHQPGEPCPAEDALAEAILEEFPGSRELVAEDMT